MPINAGSGISSLSADKQRLGYISKPVIGKVDKSLRQFLFINYNHQTILVPANLPLKLCCTMPSTTTFRCSYFPPFPTFLQSKREKKKVCLFKAEGQIPSGLIFLVLSLQTINWRGKNPRMFLLNVHLLIRSCNYPLFASNMYILEMSR